MHGSLEFFEPALVLMMAVFFWLLGYQLVTSFLLGWAIAVSRNHMILAKQYFEERQDQ